LRSDSIELLDSQTLANVQVEQGVILGGQRRSRIPDELDQLLVEQNSGSVGEAVRIDPREVQAFSFPPLGFARAPAIAQRRESVAACNRIQPRLDLLGPFMLACLREDAPGDLSGHAPVAHDPQDEIEHTSKWSAQRETNAFRSPTWAQAGSCSPGGAAVAATASIDVPPEGGRIVGQHFGQGNPHINPP
jgi:hypothetical protein